MSKLNGGRGQQGISHKYLPLPVLLKINQQQVGGNSPQPTFKL